MPDVFVFDALQSSDLNKLKEALRKKPSLYGIFYNTGHSPYCSANINAFEYALFAQNIIMTNELLNYILEADNCLVYLSQILNSINTCIFTIAPNVLSEILDKCQQHYANPATQLKDLLPILYGFDNSDFYDY